MNEKKLWRKLLSLILVGSMLLGLMLPVAASTPGGNGTSLRIEKVDNSLVNATPLGGNKVSAPARETVDKDKIVRVSIVLEEPSTIAAGYSTMNIAQNNRAMTYRESLRQAQTQVQKTIERKVLGGGKLDVVWNLTLAANLISANVRFGDIEAIEAVPGVKEVVPEMQYSPDVVSVGGELEPQMAIAGQMNGTQNAWGSGYTGAGTRIAIIDTGLDTDHQSFDPKAFLHAVQGLDVSLMVKSDIEEHLEDLNIYQEGMTADMLYISAKVPFAFNYIDGDFDITHKNDDQGEHGSHVAGIAAANRFVDTNGDGEYEKALEAVLTAGNAPDAQILVMKVFGKGGGAWDSDMAAAIEDAVLLGCDSVNLSIGSAVAGYATLSNAYAEILNNLMDSDTVVTISAGNNSFWAAETATGELYADGVNYATGGSPGSHAFAFTVASVDNLGMISPTIGVNGKNYGFNESATYGNPEIATLDTSGNGATYKFVMVNAESAGNDGVLTEALASEIKDAVYITWRGTTSFFEKANAGAAAGAAAVIICNNQPGTIGLDLTGYLGEVPVVSILQTDASEIWASGTANAEQVPGTEYKYITGKITIKKVPTVFAEDYPGHYTMSDFSSFGVPGDLTLKPEISAPGGNIWSVNGAIAGGQSYELMSGTSMAAPQVAGLSALVQQYLKDANNGIKIPDNISPRALTQSLLMATATPMTDEHGFYYPVFQQGAGLANVDDAINSIAYITVDGQADGKVKAELGDDPGREGKYTVTFTIHSLTGEPAKYALSADVFTQAVYKSLDLDTDMMGTGTDYLPASVSFIVGGEKLDVPAVTEKAQDLLDRIIKGEELGLEYDLNGDGKVTTYDVYLLLRSSDVVIETDGEDVTVIATITLDKESAKALDDAKSGAGFYVEAYIYAKPMADNEGVAAPQLSIPVLGYYGSWTDPSMYDVGSLAEIMESPAQARLPYLYGYNNVEYNYPVDGNGYIKLGEESGDPMYSYLSGNVGLSGYNYSLIRNAGRGRVQVAVNGEVKWTSEETASEYAAYYSASSGRFGYTSRSQKLDWDEISRSGEFEFKDGDKVEVSLVRAPEYYAGAEGAYNWNALGNGAYLTTTFIMDSTAPVVNEERTSAAGNAEDGYSITVAVEDNYFVSEITLYGEDGDTLFDSTYYDESYEAEKSVEYTFEDADADVYYIVVWDYADNANTYRLFVGVEETDEVEEVAISRDAVTMVKGGHYQLFARANPMTLEDRSVTWTSTDDSVVTVVDGLLTAVKEGTATIIATSVLDDTKKAECAVTVERLNVTLNGVLADDEGIPKFFTWNFGTEEFQHGALLKEFPVTAVNVDDDHFYLINDDGEMYLMDKATGEGISEPSDWSDVGSIAYTEDGMWYVADYIFGGPEDPNEDVSWWVYDFSSLLAYSGSSSIKAIAAYYPDEPWTDIDDEGNVFSGDYIIFGLTDNNYIWEIYVCNSVNGEEYDADLYSFYYSPSDLTAVISGYEGLPYSNMVFGEDGALYISMMTGDTNEIYRLVYDEVEETWVSAFLGDVGIDVWPALLLEANNNATGGSVAESAFRVPADLRPIGIERVSVSHEAFVKTAPSGTLNSIELPDPAESASNGVVVDSENFTVTVPVNVNGSTNGDFTVTYDPAVLTLEGVVDRNAMLTSVNIGDEDAEGTVRVGYAKGTEATGKFEFVFTYETALSEQNTEITLAVAEDGNTRPGPETTIKVSIEALDVTDLQAAIDAAEALIEKNYTEDSWAAMQKALAAAKAVLEKPTTQKEIDAAVAALTDAIEALVLEYTLTITVRGVVAEEDEWGDLAVTVGGDTYPDISEIVVEISPAVENPLIIITDNEDGSYSISVRDSERNPLAGATLYVTLSGEPEEPADVAITGVTVNGTAAVKGIDGNFSITLPYGSSYPTVDDIAVSVSDPDYPANLVTVTLPEDLDNPNGTYLIKVLSTVNFETVVAEATLTVTIETLVQEKYTLNISYSYTIDNADETQTTRSVVATRGEDGVYTITIGSDVPKPVNGKGIIATITNSKSQTVEICTVVAGDEADTYTVEFTGTYEGITSPVTVKVVVSDVVVPPTYTLTISYDGYTAELIDGEYYIILPEGSEYPENPMMDIVVTASIETDYAYASGYEGTYTVAVRPKGSDNFDLYTLHILIGGGETPGPEYTLTVTVRGVVAEEDEWGGGALAATVDGDTYPDISEIVVEISPEVEDPQIMITDNGDGYYTISVADSGGNPLAGATLFVTLSSESEEPADVTITGVTVNGTAATKGSDGNYSITLPYGSSYPTVDDIAVTVSDPDYPANLVTVTLPEDLDNPNGTYLIKVLSTVNFETVVAEATLTVTITTTPPAPPTVSVTGVTLNKTALSLTVGGSETLTATVAPSNATNKTVTWTSSDPAVATVSNGTVTAVAAGTATITATAGGKSATCTVTVTAAEDPGTDDPGAEEPRVETPVTPETKVETGDNGTSVSATVTESQAEDMVKQAEEEKADVVIIKPEIPENVDNEEITSAEVTIPAESLTELSEKTDADVVVETPIGSVTIPNNALDELGSAGGSVSVSVERENDGATKVEVKVDDKNIDKVEDGLKVSLPLQEGQVVVLVAEDGTETIIQKSLVDEDGTAYVLLDGSATIKVIDNSEDFKDVKDDQWYADAVDFASSHELLIGTGNNEFSPNVKMSRAMLVTVLWRLESEAKAGDVTITFDDTESGAYYTPAMAWAVSMGIVSGTGDNKFSPDREITRQELVTILYRYAKSIGLDTSSHADVSNSGVADWAEDAMSWAVAVGLIKGGDNGIDPTGTASRAQVAIILQRLVTLIVK